MSSPYDTALRVADRKLDTIRRDIIAVMQDLQRIGDAHRATETALAHESAFVLADKQVVIEQYFVAARARRLRLSAEHAKAEWRLEDLRREATECVGSRNALQSAAARYRDATAQSAATAEQSTIDDFTGAGHIAATTRARRSLASVLGSPP